jgi:hypothetical protein
MGMSGMGMRSMGMGMGGMGMGSMGGGQQQEPSRLNKLSMQGMQLMSMLQMPMMMMTQVTSMIQMQMMSMMGGVSMGLEMLQQMGQFSEMIGNKLRGVEIDPMTGLAIEKPPVVYEAPWTVRACRHVELTVSEWCQQFKLLKYVLAILVRAGIALHER